MHRSHTVDPSSDVNVTPLMDIVFIMLIFFIVTATFTREKGIDINTPEDTPDRPDEVPPPALLLSVQKDGFVDGGDEVPDMTIEVDLGIGQVTVREQ